MDVLSVVQLLDERVDLVDLLALGMIGLLCAREDRQQENLRLRLFRAQVLDDGGHAFSDFRGRVAGRLAVTLEAGVVRADHHHHGLRLDAIELAVLQPPQDVLRAVTADAEVRGLQRGEVRIPDFLATLLLAAPGVGDGVTDEEHVDIPLLGDFDEAFMALDPVSLARLGFDGGVGGNVDRRTGDDQRNEGETEGSFEVHGERDFVSQEAAGRLPTEHTEYTEKATR